MKNRTLQDLLDLHGKCLMSGKFNQILACYQEVLPLFLDGKAILIDGHDEMRCALGAFRERLLADDVEQVKGTALDGQLADEGRFSVKVRWNYFTRDFKLPRQSVVRYYCVNEPQGKKIEMVEYQQFAYKDFTGWSRFDMTTHHVSTYPTSRVLH